MADFVQRLQQVDTTPTFYCSMTLPGPFRKYRQWTPRPLQMERGASEHTHSDAPMAVGAAQSALVAPDLQRRVDTLEAELVRKGTGRCRLATEGRSVGGLCGGLEGGASEHTCFLDRAATRRQAPARRTSVVGLSLWCRNSWCYRAPCAAYHASYRKAHLSSRPASRCYRAHCYV